MKYAITFFFLSIIFQMQGQNTVTFAYDANGNQLRLRINMANRSANSGSGTQSEQTVQNLDSTKDIDLKEEIVIYPNPTNGLVQLKISGTAVEKLKLIQVFDFSGKLLFQQNSFTNELNFSNYPNGTYLLRFHMKDGSQFLKEVIKI